MGAILKIVFGIAEAETTFERRGFRGGEGGVRQRMEKVGQAFVAGYHAALENPREEILVSRLEQIDSDLRGFAYEGAAMGLEFWILHYTVASASRAGFSNGAGAPHAYMVHVALGWVTARMPGRYRKNTRRSALPSAPLARVGRLRIPRRIFSSVPLSRRPIHSQKNHRLRRARFRSGTRPQPLVCRWGNVDLLRETVAAFPEHRRPDLWSGVGLAAVYAGEVSEEQLRSLREASGIFLPQLAQGAAFAAKARHRAGNPNTHTDCACWVLCGMSSADAAAVTDAALENLPANDAEPGV